MTKRQVGKLLEVWDGVEAFKEATVEGNVIHNVALLGPKSLNGRVYTDQAMRDAVALYNGVPIYADHPGFRDLSGTGNRKFMDLAGKIANTRKVGNRVRGDVVLISDSDEGERLKAVAMEMPNMVGFSHRADGEITIAEDGTQVVERLTNVEALEIVTEPATVKGLFESISNGDEPQKPEGTGDMEIKDLTLDMLKAQRPDLLAGITESVTASVKESLKDDEATSKLTAQVATLEGEKTALQKTVDESAVADALRIHKEMVTAKLGEAKLPEKAVSDQFRTTLDEAKDEAAVDALIADRKALVEGVKTPTGAPKQGARDIQQVLEDGGEPKAVTSEAVAGASASLFH
jgi:hypothetical protein